MDRSKIKNYIIILLALVNIFLLYIVLNGTSEENKTVNYRRKALETVLKNNGITLNPDIKLSYNVPSQISLKRDTATEQSHISALIGDCEAQDQGGNIYNYIGKNGTAQFRGKGEFTVELNSGVFPENKDPVSIAKTVMKKLAMAYSDITSDPTVSENDTKVTIFCSWNDITVYDAVITFKFNDGSLCEIQGSRLLDTEYQIAPSENYLDGVSVLMRFLDYVRQTGEVCSKIDDLKLGYYRSSSVSGDCTLKPLWCIQTNSRPYYIDAQTGKTVPISNSAAGAAG